MAEGIAGIVSGIDTERLIQAMLQAESQPIKLLQGQLSALKAKGDAWNVLRTQMQTLLDLTADWQKEETWHPYQVAVEGRQGVTATLADPLKALPGIYRVTVQSLAQGETLLSAPGAVADATLPLGYTGTFSIQGETFTLSGDESLEDLARLVSSRSEITGVRARVVTPYDPATGTSGPALLLESARPGSSQRIAFSDGTSGPSGSSLLVHLGILESSADTYAQASAVVQAAADTLVQVNGVTYRQDTLTLKGIIPGVEVSLAAARAGDELSVSVQPDEGALREKVSRWVDAMNSLLQSIRNATRYDPNTRTGGPLQGDVEALLLQQALGRIPAALGELGIRQTAEGSLVFDGSRFDQAWQKDPQRVRDLLAGAGGAAPRLLDELDRWLKTGGFFDAARKVRESQDQMLQDRIRRWQDFLRQREELLRRQFNAMEDAMARMTQLSQSLQAAINLMTVQAQYGKKA